MQYNKITVSDRNERTKTADLVPVHATCGYQCVYNCAKHAPNDEKSNEGSSLSSHSSSTTGTGFENALVHAGRHATEFSTWLPACQTEDCGGRRTHNMLLISRQGTGNKYRTDERNVQSAVGERISKALSDAPSSEYGIPDWRLNTWRIQSVATALSSSSHFCL